MAHTMCLTQAGVLVLAHRPNTWHMHDTGKDLGLAQISVPLSCPEELSILEFL